MDRVDPHLVNAVREGTYIVDPYAVAGAMLQRSERYAEADRLATMLEAGEVDGLTRGGPDLDSGTRGDIA